MYSRKERPILFTKSIATFFVVFMMCVGVNIVRDIMLANENEEIEKQIETKYKEDLCKTYWMFHIFAFGLGAIWNMKKLLKLGIV